MTQLTKKFKDGSMRFIEVPLPVVASGTVLAQNFFSLINVGMVGGTPATIDLTANSGQGA
jgi:hypothetical protein